MLSDLQHELAMARRDMHRMADQFNQLVARVEAVKDFATAEAIADDVQDRPHHVANFQGVTDEAVALLEQIKTLPAWAASHDPENDAPPKYRVTQMIRRGQKYWVVVNADTTGTEWPVYSSGQRHQAIAERDRLNALADAQTVVHST